MIETPPKHSKLRGELAELHFLTRATELGFCVSKPWGDSSRYDFAVETGGRFMRVQVKSTRMRFGKHYFARLVRSRQRPYEIGDFDFFAIYIVPHDLWYIVPLKLARGVISGISLSPHNSLSKHAAYKEAWHLLRGESRGEPAHLRQIGERRKKIKPKTPKTKTKAPAARAFALGNSIWKGRGAGRSVAPTRI